MSADGQESGFKRVVGRLPSPVRDGLILLFVAPLVFAKWEIANDHKLSPALWVLLGVAGTSLAVVSLRRFITTFGSADRSPLGRADGWDVFLISTGVLLVVGAWSMFDGQLAFGGVMFAVGLAMAVLFARHMLKPVRRGAGPSSPWRAKGPW